MRCSRVAWSLLLAVLGGAVMALGLADGRQGVAADLGPEQPTCVDTLNRADDFQEASHWSDACATDGEQPWTENSYESYAPCEDETAATGAEEEQYESRNGNQENADDEYDEYESNYADDYEDASTDESDESVEDVETETDAAAEDDYSYKYDEYESNYGYKYEDASTDESDEAVEDVETETDAAAEDDYSYEYDEYQYEDPYTDDEYGAEDEMEVDAEATDAETETNNYGYHGYSEAYPNEEDAYEEEEVGSGGYSTYGEFGYGYDGEPAREVDGGTAEDCPGDYRCYDEETETDSTGHLELGAWLPGELLTASDRHTLRKLEQLSEEPSGVRRAVLNNHLKGLGAEALGFGDRFEDSTGIEILGLADDTPGAAALLGTIHLIERGDVAVDEGVEMLRRGLESLPEEWLDEITRITSEPAGGFDDSAATRTILGMVASWASASVEELSGVLRGISGQLSRLSSVLAAIGGCEEREVAGSGASWERL